MDFSAGLQFLLPELTLVFFAFVSLLGGAFWQNKRAFPALALVALAISGYLLPQSSSQIENLFSGMLSNDPVGLFFRGLFLLIAVFIVLMTLAYDEEQEDRGEFYFFLLLITATMMLAVASRNLLFIYLTLEAVSLISYLLAGYLKRDLYSSEAGIKYFLFGALATGITLYGITLVYGLFGSLDLPIIWQQLTMSNFHPLAIAFSFLLIFSGFAFKCSLAPMHMWTPDVYQGAPTPVAAFLSVAPKAMGFALLFKIFLCQQLPIIPQWETWTTAIAIITMTLGNLVALRQNNVKRMLAYSTIAQAGYIFVGLTVGTADGFKATAFYLVAYVIMNLGAFAGLLAITGNSQKESLSDFAGAFKKDPLSAIVMGAALVSLAGIPPFAGFLAKFFVLSAAVGKGAYLLAFAVILNSVVGLYYYVSLLRCMFILDPSETIDKKIIHPALRFTLLILLLGNILLGVYPQLVWNYLVNF